jgi:hypothetical protein
MRICGSILGSRKRFAASQKVFRAALGDAQHPILKIPEGHSLGGEGNHSPPLPTAKFKNKWSCLPSSILFHISSIKRNRYAFVVPAAFNNHSVQC